MQFLALLLTLVVTIVVTNGFQILNNRMNTGVLSMVKVGDIAPDFELTNYQGKTFKLSSYKSKKPVVVFFYPADNSPGCTKEVDTFTSRRIVILK